MLRSILMLIGVSLATSSWAIQVNDRVENFRLFDHEGASHELYYFRNAKAIVFMVQGNGCPIVRNAMPRFKELRDEFADKNVQFLMVNSNLQDSRESIAAEVAKYGYDIPILKDETQIIGEALDFVRTGEVFIVDPKTWTIAYQGAVDDRLSYENQKEQASAHYLQDAINNMIDGEVVKVANTNGIGCLINFPEQQAMAKAKHTEISYSADIAPMLLDNCVTCHREGGLGPWAMSDYNMVRGFSQMIREVVRTQRMPPWHADPAIGDWHNDRSLSSKQIQTLVHWIEAGAPRGEGEDFLATDDTQYFEWDAQDTLGEPDFVIDIPAMEVPAAGVVDYQYHFVENTVGKDVWVRAAEIKPGDRAVLHHTITTFGYDITEGEHKGRFNRIGGLRGYAPGLNNEGFPEGTGIFLPADAKIEFQMHYTPVGRATVDESQMGLWVYDEPPTHKMISMFVANTRIKIPANANNHKEIVEQVIPKDALLYSLMPHAHFRGKAAEFRAIYPDGSQEVLLSVPNYDFNWQTTYEFTEPKFLPAGTKLVQANWWDNSAQNLANPDPSIEVTWGEQSWEEMLFGAFTMRFLTEEEIEERRTASTQKEETAANAR
ncbi:MAG: redoxin domain-containing protein [Gammaproteobacteria bacterium]|nr:redoxin domain-containing protein [Gammaproteobacteria bacterium]